MITLWDLALYLLMLPLHWWDSLRAKWRGKILRAAPLPDQIVIHFSIMDRLDLKEAQIGINRAMNQAVEDIVAAEAQRHWEIMKQIEDMTG